LIFPGATVADVTFVGAATGRPVISTLAREHAVDVNILAGAIETVGGSPVGRLRIELPGLPEANAAHLAFLRKAGLTVEIAPAVPQGTTRDQR
jgi:D-methionine transport system ATP-binding protein